MPTNQEWLNQLATESPDKLKAWFDAEHNDNLAAEKVVSCDAAHSNDGNAHLKASEDLSDAFSDSREKLEADVYNYIAISITPNKEDDGVLAPYTTVLEWLDRQAAITERETKLRELYKFEENHRYHIRSIEEVNQKLNKRIAELTAERDEWKAKAKSILNAESYKFASEPDAESYIDCGKVENDSREKLEADVREWVDDIGWLSDKETQVADFIAWLDRQAAITNAAWKSLKESWVTAHDSLLIENGELREEVDRLQRRNDELRTSYDKLKRERDNLAADLLTCNREREQLRKHLGIALDHAHDICSLVDIDGNVLDVGD